MSDQHRGADSNSGFAVVLQMSFVHHTQYCTKIGSNSTNAVFLLRSIGCLCPDCELCKQAQHRRCTSCFGSKYLSGDALKAKCGAPIMVEIINPRTGDVVSTDKISDIQLEVGLATVPCTAATSFCVKLVHHSAASILGLWLTCSTTARKLQPQLL